MKIVSFSVQDGLFEELEKLRKELKFSGRSEVIRHGIKLIGEESKMLERMKGHIDCVLLIIHENSETSFTKLLHDKEELIKMQTHSKLCNSKCQETFILHGNAEKIRELYGKLRTNRKIEYIKIIVP